MKTEFKKRINLKCYTFERLQFIDIVTMKTMKKKFTMVKSVQVKRQGVLLPMHGRMIPAATNVEQETVKRLQD